MIRKVPSAVLKDIQVPQEELEKARALLKEKNAEDHKKKKSLNNSMMQWLNKNKDCADNAAAASSKEKEREECLVKFEEDYFASSTEKEREKCLVKFFDDYFDDQSTSLQASSSQPALPEAISLLEEDSQCEPVAKRRRVVAEPSAEFPWKEFAYMD